MGGAIVREVDTIKIKAVLHTVFSTPAAQITYNAPRPLTGVKLWCVILVAASDSGELT